MREEDLHNTPSFRYKQKVSELVKVLEDLYNITFFHFGRVDYKLGRITLGNSLNFALRYWNEYVDVDPAFQKDRVHGYDFLIFGQDPKNQKEKEMYEVRAQVYNLPEEGILLVRETEQYRDTFNFGSIDYQNNRLNPLIHNIPNLWEYCKFFVDEVDDILKDTENYHAVPETITPTYNSDGTKVVTSSGSVPQFENKLTNRFITERLLHTTDVLLTRAEAECLQWARAGKTAEETAMILGNSRRTVEGHLSSIRQKLDCGKTAQAIVEAERRGYIVGDKVYTSPQRKQILPPE